LTSRQKVDWQYVNKYPTILTTGDVDIVMRVVLDNITDFEGLALYRATDKN
jgi:AICAR transformylase/IMP cyclohydrolase PurH